VDYKDKKILLMGLGGFAKGSGVSCAEFLASRGADLTITDLKSTKDLTHNLRPLKKFKNIKYVLGEHRTSDFENTHWVVKNPDVPPSSAFLSVARVRKTPIDNDITLFFREYGVGRVIGVTGTRGKSTTTALIYEMARRQFKSARFGGNIGESPLRFLDEIKNGPAVLELSNFQLSDLDTIKMSPHVAVWTNLYPDHLNKYPSIAEYIADKEKIFQYQKAGDVAVLNLDNEITKKIGEGLKKAVKGRHVLFFSLQQKPRDGAYIKNNWFVFVEGGKETKICRTAETKLLGEHNLANTLAAICAARFFGVGWPAIKLAIKKFKGVPNRLEVIKKIGGITFINDCTATSPQATIAALRSFALRRVVLITGGNSKGFSLEEMIEEIGEKAKAVVLMPGNVSGEILRGAQGAQIPVKEVKDLKEAVRTARKLAQKGDYIILSPGLTWLPRQNEFARGEEFRKIVKRLS